jgi:hypothetical protein
MSTRKQRLRAERNRRYQDRLKTEKLAAAAELRRQDTARLARQEAQRERIAERPAGPCEVKLCQVPVSRGWDVYGYRLCDRHASDMAVKGLAFLDLTPYKTAQDEKPGTLPPPATQEPALEPRSAKNSHPEYENPFVWQPPKPDGRPPRLDNYIVAPPTATYSTATGYVELPPTDPPGVRFSQFSEASGMTEQPTRAELIASARRTREAAAGRTWSQDDIVRFDLAVRDRMNRRNDEQSE